MNARVVLIAAMASGQGKTSVTAALARWLIHRGERVRIFKIGADFIDPLMLERACGHPVPVLDLWMVGEPACRRMLAQAARVADTVLIEAAMGLYDGNPSAADLARVLALPVIAVLDVSAMAQTAGAVAMGLRDFGRIALAGIIANRVDGKGHGTMIAESLGSISLLGSLPRQSGCLPERHLGLALPAEARDLEHRLDALAGNIVAIARDAAFTFLHPANIECLKSLGATIRWFSPLADEPPPENATAVILPGGYPELHAETLSRASHFHASLRNAHRRHVPILAECGGITALTDALIDVDGRFWSMAGLIPGTTWMQAQLAGLGFHAWRTRKGILRGHTFHYSKLETQLKSSTQTITHPQGTAGESIYRVGSVTASYFHAYFPSCPEAVVSLLRSPAQITFNK